MKKRYPVTLMAGPCTPWTPDYKLDERALRAEICALAKAGITSLYFFGTAGEGYALSRDLFSETTAVILDECAKHQGMTPMIGIIGTAMTEMVDRIGLARDMGARDFQAALPCWGAMDQRDVRYFWKTLCAQFPDCRFMSYNNANRTKTKISIADLVALAEEIPNLAAAKCSTRNITELYEMATAETGLTFYVVDLGYEYASMFGSVGLISSFICLDSAHLWAYFNAGQRQDFPLLIQMSRYIVELLSAFDTVDASLIDSAYDKAIGRVADGSFPSRLMPPYTGLSEEDFQTVAVAMRRVVAKYQEGS
ncbi:MAG: dihydrodipicolinate synthase family protein [Clostridia bacterium]|nr:dihydrodipicolinate synthase family protein [Clostridia bacterium]